MKSALSSRLSSKRSSVQFDDSVQVFEFEPQDNDDGGVSCDTTSSGKRTDDDNVVHHSESSRNSYTQTEGPENFDVESIILDDGQDENPSTAEVFDKHDHEIDKSESAITFYKVPLTSFITQFSSIDSLFDQNLPSSDQAKKKRQKVQLTAQNSHPDCFAPVTASKIHGGVLGKRQYRPRKSRKQIFVRNEINFPPIRSSPYRS